MFQPDPSPVVSISALAPPSQLSALGGDGRAQMFRNRLRKNLKRLLPWAKQSQLEAYRIYDSDIPEVRITVERYGDSLVVWEYARRAEQEEDGNRELAAAHERFLAEVLGSLAAECGVKPESIFFKRRQRQRRQGQRPEQEGSAAGQQPGEAQQAKESGARRGIKQYEKLSDQRCERLVKEGGNRFWVNLSDYVDTGLFLDHRQARALIGQMASGKRLLNLFGYTGSFSVYAAAGGAESTLTVDLSPTYLDWADRNFAENRLDRQRHELLRADVMALLGRPGPHLAGRPSALFDLIVLDPPTFSNSKKMRGTLDVDRDHPWLIGQAMKLLAPGGVILFSSNHRRFSLRAGDIQGGASAAIRDVTLETLPRDFHDPRTRCCYLISRTQ